MRNRRRTAWLPALFLGVALIGCDDDGTMNPPNAEQFEFSFEDGLGQWSAEATDTDSPPVTWDVEASGMAALEGTMSARLTLDNQNDKAKVWLERELALAPNTTYDLTVSYDFGTADFGVNQWTIITGVHATSPSTASDLTFQGSTGNGSGTDQGLVWVPKSFDFTATTDDTGNVYLAIGVWGTSTFARDYFIDDVNVVAVPQ